VADVDLVSPILGDDVESNGRWPDLRVLDGGDNGVAVATVVAV